MTILSFVLAWTAAGEPARYSIARASSSYEASGEGYVLKWTRGSGARLYKVKPEARPGAVAAAAKPAVAAAMLRAIIERLDKDGWGRRPAPPRVEAEESLRRMGYLEP
jgi:hypothetical protein